MEKTHVHDVATRNCTSTDRRYAVTDACPLSEAARSLLPAGLSWRKLRGGRYEVKVMRQGVPYWGGATKSLVEALEILAEVHTALLDVQPLKRGPKHSK